MNKKLNVALFAGGDSSERKVSLGSAAQVRTAFDPAKYEVFTVDIQGRSWNCTDGRGQSAEVDKNDFSVTLNGVRTSFDYAFIMIHGTPGEDGKLQGYLEMMRVPYSSCRLTATVATFDKALCKRLVTGIPGLWLAEGVAIRKGSKIVPDELALRLGLPLFVKPNASGSSCGVSKVKSVDQIVPAIEKAFCESDTVLAEEFLEGREFGCGVICTKKEFKPLPVTEIVSRNEFFDYEAKYTVGLSDEITPAQIPGELSAELQRLAVAACERCGCRGVVRIDFIVRGDGRPYLVEINSVPGMSAESIVPKQLKAAGMTMTELLDIIVEDTL